MCRVLVASGLAACAAPASTSPQRPAAPAPEPAAAQPCPAPEAAPPSLADLGLERYPDQVDFVLPDGIIEIAPLRDEDVAPDFDNLDDLAWLAQAARGAEVVLIGENHWNASVHRMVRRMLFALARADRLALLTKEQAYSEGPFLDHYINLADDAAAGSFYRAELAPRVDTVELRELLEHLRAWNKRNPDRRLRMFTHDIEHSPGDAITHVVNPYLRALDPRFAVDADDYRRDPEAGLRVFERGLAVARTRRHRGRYPFITDRFVTGVVANLRARYLASTENFHYYRQRAIVRNLTDPDYLGAFVKRGRVAVWAGSNHTVTRRDLPGGGNFLREGAYLTHDFAPTRGKTYSVSVQALSVSLGAMASADVDNLQPVADDHQTRLRRLQRARALGHITADDFVFTTRDPSNQFAAAIAATNDHQPFRLTRIHWDKLLPLARLVSRDAVGALREARRELDSHDAVVIVPRSPTVRVLPRASK